MPFVYATGKQTSVVIPGGMPSSSATSSRFPFSMVAYTEPRPRDRSARLKLHADWMPLSKRPGLPLLS